MKTIAIFFFSIIVFSSCKEEKPKNYLEIYALNPDLMFPMTIYGCKIMQSDFLKEKKTYTKIEDQKVVNKVLNYFNSCKLDKHGDVKNIRYQIIIHKELQTDTLCLGGHFGTFKNGKKVIDSPEIFKILKDEVHWK